MLLPSEVTPWLIGQFLMRGAHIGRQLILLVRQLSLGRNVSKEFPSALYRALRGDLPVDFAVEKFLVLFIV